MRDLVRKAVGDTINIIESAEMLEAVQALEEMFEGTSMKIKPGFKIGRFDITYSKSAKTLMHELSKSLEIIAMRSKENVYEVIARCDSFDTIEEAVPFNQAPKYKPAFKEKDGVITDLEFTRITKPKLVVSRIKPKLGERAKKNINKCLGWVTIRDKDFKDTEFNKLLNDSIFSISEEISPETLSHKILARCSKFEEVEPQCEIPHYGVIKQVQDDEVIGLDFRQTCKPLPKKFQVILKSELCPCKICEGDTGLRLRVNQHNITLGEFPVCAECLKELKESI